MDQTQTTRVEATRRVLLHTSPDGTSPPLAFLDKVIFELLSLADTNATDQQTTPTLDRRSRPPSNPFLEDNRSKRKGLGGNQQVHKHEQTLSTVYLFDV